MVAFDDLDRLNLIQINDANPDNIRSGVIEYSLDWATITSYEDPRSGDSAINIRFVH